MQYKLILEDNTTYQGDLESLYDFVGSLSPDNYQLIQSLANAATSKTEKYLGAPIGKRNFTYVLNRGEGELNDNYIQNWMSSPCFFNMASHWIQLYTPVDSIDQISIGIWGGDDIILVENYDYSIDIDGNYPRIILSSSLQIQDYFIKYKNIKIKCSGGIHDVDGGIPYNIDIAIKMMTKSLFSDRGDVSKNYDDNGYRFLLEDYQVSPIGGGR